MNQGGLPLRMCGFAWNPCCCPHWSCISWDYYEKWMDLAINYQPTETYTKQDSPISQNTHLWFFNFDQQHAPSTTILPASGTCRGR